MTTLSHNSHLAQNTPKKYHTFQIVNENKKKHYSSGIFSKIGSFFLQSPSTSKSPTPDSISSRAEILNTYNNVPSNTTYYLFYFNVLSCSISFTLIIPSLWSYLRELECTELYLAYCISIYAIGELCGSYLASMIKNKYNTKFVLILSMISGVSGGFIYGSAGLVEYYLAPYFVLIGRTMQGIWTGMEQYTEIKYLSDNIDFKKNVKALNKISLVSSIGFILGPLIGIVLQLINNFNIGWMYISSNMLCGYFISILCIIQIIITLITFDNKVRIELPKRNTVTRTASIQPRINVTYSTPKYTMSINNSKKLTFSDASPPAIKFSKMNWIDSASPPSTLPCIPDNADSFDEYNYTNTIKNINVSEKEKEKEISYVSDVYHRASISDILLNINTSSDICTPSYNGYKYKYEYEYEEYQTNQSECEYEVEAHSYYEVNKFAFIVMCFCFFIHFEQFSIQQTMTAYLIERNFDWNIYVSHYLFVICGIIWMISFYVINRLLMLKSVNKSANMFLVKISLFLGVISAFLEVISTLFPNIKYNEGLYVIGFILISFTFPFGRASVLSLYCLSTNYQYINWIYLVSIISRALTPFIGVSLYFIIKGPAWMYGNIIVLFMIAIILCSLTTVEIKIPKTQKKINTLQHGFSIINMAIVPQVLQ